MSFRHFIKKLVKNVLLALHPGCYRINKLVTLICLLTLCRKELVVGVTKELTMNIRLSNSGEDSYMTSMVLNYPRNLHFKRIQKVIMTAVLETCHSWLFIPAHLPPFFFFLPLFYGNLLTLPPASS